ncbi:META domain-containing protein [Thaumasiovibrio sp. DFM-14]|uniref:META domain-containing protein n=1 Tax=Thaumasiovibrio sp. DFM-14 TaxID=3384792 RepID=UPI0039A16CB7
MKSITTLALTLLTLAGCSMTSDPTINLANNLANKEWQLAAIDSSPIDPATIQHPPTFMMATNGRISGHGGCNHYFGDTKISNSYMMAPGLATTKMLCIQNEVATIESQLLKALTQGVDVEFSDNDLILVGDDHQFIFQTK